MLKRYENKMYQPLENKVKKKWFILASGASLTREDVERVKGQNVIAINDNYKLAPWADIIYACDPQWWGWHMDDVKSFKGRKITQDESWNDYPDLKSQAIGLGVEFYHSIAGGGIDEESLYQGCHSGIQAINLAYLLGAKEIYLLGYDMQKTNGKDHWFGAHPNNAAPEWSKRLKHYEPVARDAKRLGVEIINCSRETALTCFDRKTIDEVL